MQKHNAPAADVSRSESRSGLSPEPPDAVVVHFGGLHHLATLRRMVGRFAGEAGLDPNRAADFELAVSELATNSVQHGGGAGRLSFWSDQDAVVCEMRDRGRLAEPLGDPEPPAPTARAGRGLWLVARLSDGLARQTTSEGVTTRVIFRYEAPPADQPTERDR